MVSLKNMLRYIIISVLLLCSSLLLADNTISLNIKDMPVRDVITNLMAQSDVNIIMTDDSAMDKRIRINLNNCELEKALTYIMQASGLSYKKMDNNTYIISAGVEGQQENLFSPESLLSNVQTETVSSFSSDIKKSDDKKEFALDDIHVIELVHSNPTELLKAMGWRGNTEQNYYLQQDTYKKHNNKVKYDDQGQITVPSLDTFIDDGSGRFAELDTLSGARNNSSSSSSSGSSRNSGSNSNGNSSNGSSNSSGSGGSSFGGSISFLDAYNNDNVFYALVPYDLNNSIMVRGDEKAVEQFIRDVQVFDIPPRQVEVKCEFIQIETNNTKSFGIDWNISRTGRYFDTNFNPSGNVIFNFATGNLTANLAAELSDTIGKLVNSPIISTFNNIEGYISINTSIPKFSSQISGDGVNPIATYSSQDVDVTSELTVTPRINRDNSITMIIDANIGDIVDYVESPDGKSASPMTTDQEISCIRRVYDGETVVIGGFIRQQNETDTTKIPLLGDLPLLGNLFRNSSTSKSESELLIFITPRIIHDSINMNKPLS